ncbi:MAG: hypothetical protein V4577_24245 [Bacteroidota bacterium]
MKTTLFFIFTCLVSTGAMLGALHEKNPFPNFAVAFGIWIFFIWVRGRRSRKRNRQNIGEQQFRDYMRAKYNNHQH